MLRYESIINEYDIKRGYVLVTSFRYLAKYENHVPDFDGKT